MFKRNNIPNQGPGNSCVSVLSCASVLQHPQASNAGAMMRNLGMPISHNAYQANSPSVASQ